MQISINLLPPEVIEQELKKSKFDKIQFAGVAVVLIMIFLSSLTLTLQVLQTRNIKMYQARLTQAEASVSGQRNIQAALFLLQGRLVAIGQYLGVPSKQSSIYNLLDQLIPASAQVQSITIGGEGEAKLQIAVHNSESLDQLMKNLTEGDPDAAGNISQLSVESLGRNRDGSYRLTLKIIMKES